MIEPTETESKETLDEFVKILAAINEEIRSNPEKVLNAPHTTPVSRIDEVQAARQLNLRYKPANVIARSEATKQSKLSTQIASPRLPAADHARNDNP